MYCGLLGAGLFIQRWEVGGSKSPKLCLRNIWMVPNTYLFLLTAVTTLIIAAQCSGTRLK